MLSPSTELNLILLVRLHIIVFFDPLAITQILELIHGDRSETGKNQVLYQIGKIHLEITEFGRNISLALIAWIH